METEYRDQLLAEMRLGDRAESVRPYLLPWLESSQAALLDRLSLPAAPQDLALMNAMAIVLASLKRSLANDIDAGMASREEFRANE